MALTTGNISNLIKNPKQDSAMAKVKVKVLRPFWIVEEGKREVVKPGREVEIDEFLALELKAANKVSFDLSKRGRPAKDEAVDPVDFGNKSEKKGR
jgi:hypothetical protein